MTTAPSRSRPTPRRGENMLTLGNIVAIPYSPRSAVLAVVSILVILVLATGIVAWGPMGVGPAELSALLRGEAESSTIFVLERLRGPRVLVAIGVGIALGLAGALFQTVTRNPLGSPDVIGLSAGAGAGVAVAAALIHNSEPPRSHAISYAGFCFEKKKKKKKVPRLTQNPT
ncbi:iron chelate uptake ABC transporter family permease subunit [Auritidibacter ignavus]|uniref:iron chelate uptake ABC transporter family permease subunit n=1 Tax=Auritidibacter ignavus TaxID=678932 RepID=UPI0021045DDD|nr:iron chelate uptake ABC transporter family permease subunit [Auritidibacter ignavus]